MESFSSVSRRYSRPRLPKTHRGAAAMASSAGAPTVATQRAPIPAGIRRGGECSEKSMEPAFENELAMAVSNRPERGNGRDIYRKQVKPSQVGLDRVAAVFAITSLFQPPIQAGTIHSYDVQREDFELIES